MSFLTLMSLQKNGDSDGYTANCNVAYCKYYTFLQCLAKSSRILFQKYFYFFEDVNLKNHSQNTIEH